MEGTQLSEVLRVTGAHNFSARQTVPDAGKILFVKQSEQR
jgi:hypothetical protein